MSPRREQPRREPIFSARFQNDLDYWQQTAPALAERLMRLVDAIVADPLHGIGKPEPLKFGRRGYWSRRLTDEHRVVYAISETEILFLSARFHYGE